MKLFASILEEVDKWTKKDMGGNAHTRSKGDIKRTTFGGIEIAEGNEHKLIIDEVTFNHGQVFSGKNLTNSSGEVPIETPIDLTKDMNKEELTKYVEREWNRGKYQAGKK